LYWLLNKYAFGPLIGMMEKRRQRVLEEMEKAEADRKKAEQLLAEQTEALQTARKEAYEVLEKARQTSSKQADDLIREARAEAARLKEDALRDIENEKQKAMADLRTQVGELSVLIASKIIEKEVDAKEQEALIREHLEGAGGRS
jgi:F-type H+-transporting ATPase subunit b